MFDVVEGGRCCATVGNFGCRDHDTKSTIAGGTDSESFVRFPDFGDNGGQFISRHGHVHFADQRVGARRLAGKPDVDQLPNSAAAAVAAHEVTRVKCCAVG